MISSDVMRRPPASWRSMRPKASTMSRLPPGVVLDPPADEGDAATLPSFCGMGCTIMSTAACTFGMPCTIPEAKPPARPGPHSIKWRPGPSLVGEWKPRQGTEWAANVAPGARKDAGDILPERDGQIAHGRRHGIPPGRDASPYLAEDARHPAPHGAENAAHPAPCALSEPNHRLPLLTDPADYRRPSRAQPVDDTSRHIDNGIDQILKVIVVVI